MIENESQEVRSLHPDGFTAINNVAKLYDTSVATLRRRWTKGQFPRPVKLKGSNKNYFRNSDLLEYNEQLETA